MACAVTIVVDHAHSDDPIFTVEVRTPWSSLDVMAEVTLSGRSLRLMGMHIGGDPMTSWGGRPSFGISPGGSWRRWMSTRSTLLAAFGQRVQIRDAIPVREGSAERVSLKRLVGANLDTVAAARALVRRHLPVKAAHAVTTELFDTGEAYVEVPKVESLDQLIVELKALGIEARKHGPDPISVRSVREALHLSQAQFALRFGLEEATVKNWEQGKSKPNATAMALLWTIYRHPEAVVDALAMRGSLVDEVAMPAFRRPA